MNDNIMKTISLFTLFFALLFSSCQKGQSTTRAIDEESLASLRTKIMDQIDTAICTDPLQWSFTALGSKACGGPQTYIAYPHSIDTVAFLQLVKKYNEAERAFNVKHGVISDCMAILPPAAVSCVDGKPVLVYQNIIAK